MPKPNCTEEVEVGTIEFGRLGRRVVEGRFDGGSMTSDGGVMLLGEVDRKLGLIEAASRCIADPRSPLLIKHAVRDMLRQRVYGLAGGSERPRGAASGRGDANRRRCGSRGGQCAHAVPAGEVGRPRHRVALAPGTGRSVGGVRVSIGASFKSAPEELVLDFDATDNPLHGQQEGRFIARQPDDVVHARALAPVDDALAAEPRVAAEDDANASRRDRGPSAVCRAHRRWQQREARAQHRQQHHPHGIGVKAGVEPLALWHAIRQGAIGRSRTFDRIGDQYLQSRYETASFTLRLAYKDMTLALDVAHQLGVPMKHAEVTYKDYAAALERGWGDLDSRSPMQLQNERAGVTIKVSAEDVHWSLECQLRILDLGLQACACRGDPEAAGGAAASGVAERCAPSMRLGRRYAHSSCWPQNTYSGR
jgi:hypothetical protein